MEPQPVMAMAMMMVFRPEPMTTMSMMTHSRSGMV